MSRITIQTIESAVDGVKPRLEAAKKAGGFVPNLLGVLGNAPTAIETYQTVSGINQKSSLSPTEIEVIQITAAIQNGCGFCVAGHTKLAEKKIRMDQPVVTALREDTTLPDDKLNALAQFTKQVIASKGGVNDDQLQAFYAAGYTEQSALEVILGVSLSTLCNYANNLAKTPINPELQPYALA